MNLTPKTRLQFVFRGLQAWMKIIEVEELLCRKEKHRFTRHVPAGWILLAYAPKDWQTLLERSPIPTRELGS